MKDSTLLAALAVLVAISAWILSRPSRKPKDLTPKQQLLRACLGDKKLMNRLVRIEMSKTPGIAKAEAITRALEALRRDNR